jgi:HD-like signal output (HDOD) protein
MPKMDGAQLLDKVKLMHPDVIRVVLSGQSSRAAVLRSIAPAHQFLSKPCDPQELMVRLGQAFAMRDLLSNEALKTTISRLRSVPSLPSIYGELMEALRKEDPPISQLAKIIAKDVGMAAKILQLANSAFIGARGRVSNLLQAVSMIGTETVRTLVLSVHVFSHFDDNSEIAPFLQPLWEHSVGSAAVAQKISIAENAPKTVVEESFTAGLLHDVGKIVLMAEMPENYLSILREDRGDICEHEKDQLGCTHSQVGAYLMSIWGLPVPLVRAVAFHHNPSEAGEEKFSSLTAVHAADALTNAIDPCPANHDGELDRKYLEALGLWQRVDTWRAFPEAQLLVRAAGAGAEQEAAKPA